MRTPGLGLALAAAAGALLLVGPWPLLTTLSAAPKGCGRDTDCKGARVCDHGRCVDPAPRPAAPPPPAPIALLPVDAAPADAVDGGAPALILPAITLPGQSAGFHGGWAHTGRSRFAVSRDTPRRLATFATGGTVFSSPAITDEGVAIFGSHDRALYAVGLDGDKAALRWKRATSDLVWSAPALGPGPAGAAPTVYAGSDDDTLYALSAADGGVRWTFAAGPCKRAIGFGPEAARCDVDGVTVGPDGTVLIAADGVYALAPDGRLLWRYALRTHCATPPAVAPDGTVYVGCQDGRVYAIGLDGIKRWDFRTNDDVDSPPAVAADGTVYVGSDDGKLYALSPAGALRFALKTGGDVRGGPAIAEDGTVYVGSFDGSLYAVRPEGTVAWTFSTADRVLSSPAIDATGVVVFGSQDDRVYAVAPDGKLLWSVLLGGDVDSTPAIGAGGTIFVGSDDKLLHVLR